MNASPDKHGDRSGLSGARRVLVRDFLQKGSVALDSREDDLSPEDALIEGEFLNLELRRGLFLHFSDAMEQHDFTARSILRDGLSCVFFLDGAIDLKIGDRHFGFRGNPRGAMEGAAITSAEPDSFERTSRGRQRVRHLVVSATAEWLNLAELAATHRGHRLTGLFKNHLQHRRWTLPPRVVRLVEEICAPSPLMPELRQLYLEGKAVELIMESISAASGADRHAVPDGVLTRHEMNQLRRARELIETRLMGELSVETIARGTGTSASRLQRLFHLAERCSVFEYVRRRRLERAFEALQNDEASVQQAAALAGYAHPANFATAFKRRFGFAPRLLPASARREPT